MRLTEKLKLKDRQAILNAKRILSQVELVVKQDLEEGRGIDDGWDDSPPQTLYDCYVRRNNKLIAVCSMYVNGTRVLGYFPFRITKCCACCGMLGNDPDMKSEPELDSLFVTLMTSGAEFIDNDGFEYPGEPERWECLECQQTMGFGYDFWDVVEKLCPASEQKKPLN